MYHKVTDSGAQEKPLPWALNNIKIRLVSVISLITSERLGTTKPIIVSIKDRQVEAQ